MTRVITRTVTHSLIRTVLGVGALAFLAVEAGAVSPGVTSACASDYLTYCSQHPTEGAAVRKCMRVNGTRLSATCINALIAAGEVSKKEVERRAASDR